MNGNTEVNSSRLLFWPWRSYNASPRFQWYCRNFARQPHSGHPEVAIQGRRTPYRIQRITALREQLIKKNCFGYALIQWRRSDFFFWVYFLFCMRVEGSQDNSNTRSPPPQAPNCGSYNDFLFSFCFCFSTSLRLRQKMPVSEATPMLLIFFLSLCSLFCSLPVFLYLYESVGSAIQRAYKSGDIVVHIQAWKVL